ncbi:MAG: glycosyltransferase family 2 protein [Bacteroidota bacterium]|nr:glycosyltransferase family 2 protein [Bacteroidota bacterium]
MQPLVSIVCTIYNAEHYIDEAIQSILNQTYTHWELLLYNDGSTDSTASVLENYRKDSRIRIFNVADNIGVYASRKFLYQQCLGKYIAVIDADDISVKSRIQKQVNYLEQHTDINAVGGHKICFDETEGSWYFKKYPTNGHYLKAAMLFRNEIDQPTIMLRKDVVLASILQVESSIISQTSSQMAEDYNLFWKLITKNFKILNLNAILIYYRIHTQQISFYSKSESRKAFTLAMWQTKFNYFELIIPDEDLIFFAEFIMGKFSLSKNDFSIINSTLNTYSKAVNAKSGFGSKYVQAAFLPWRLKSITDANDIGRLAKIFKIIVLLLSTNIIATYHYIQQHLLPNLSYGLRNKRAYPLPIID